MHRRGPKNDPAPVALAVGSAIRAATLLLLLATSAARAADIVVTIAEDGFAVDGNCTLREAIYAARAQAPYDECPASAGSNTIWLQHPGPYVLTIPGSGENDGAAGDLDLAGPLEIRSSDASPRTIDAGGLDRAFHLHSGVVHLFDLVVTGGVVGAADGIPGGGGILIVSGSLSLERGGVLDNNAAGSGGGILVTGGSVSLYDSEVSGNHAPSGGGIRVDGNSTAQIWRSSIARNRADGGCGLYLAGSGLGTSWLYESAVIDNSPLAESLPRLEESITVHGGGLRVQGSFVQIRNTTFSGNVATGNGGGITLESGTIDMWASTVTANQAALGGGIANPSLDELAFQIHDSIVAGNAATVLGDDCNGSIVSKNFNLIGSSTLCTLVESCGAPCSDLLDVAPLLSDLGLHGGATPNHLLFAESPAIDAGTTVSCESQDQRGVARPADGNADLEARCDIGAVEMETIVLFADGFGRGDTSSWSVAVGE